MVANTNKTPKLYVLLIGINYYLPNQLPGGGKYGSLGGCVRDIALVEEFLKTRLQVPDQCIFKLTSSKSDANEPSEPPDRLPTYENIVRAFQNLTDIAQPGDQVYIHYSGHGGRTFPTKFPELKGRDAKDESLVPFNIGLPEARYLRDVELAYLIQKMVDKKQIVTVVLDSCHSGGATRGEGDAIARGIDEVDSTPRSMESLVATDEDLAQTWRSLSSTFSGNSKQGFGWLPDPQGYTLLAACRPHESAYETRCFDNNSGSNGALTYYLVEALRNMEPNFTTYHLIYNNVLPRIRSHFKQQTPMLQGEGERVVFGSDRLQPVYAVNVTEVERERVLLDTGKAQGMRSGAEFAIYPARAIDFTQVGQRLALVRVADVEDVGAVRSWATIVKRFSSASIEIGARAVLLDPGSMRLRSNICLVRDRQTESASNEDDALERVRQALERDGKGFAVLADDKPIDYQVAVNAKEAYEIWDAAGNAIELRPPIFINSDNAATQVVRRLVHLTKYHNIQRLENNNSLSPLKGKLKVELLKARSDYEPDDAPEPQPFQNPSEPAIGVGEWMFIHVRNDSRQFLNVAILGLQADWGIKHLYPNSDMNFWSFDPGEGHYIPIRPQLPEGYAEGTDIVKVFATIGPTQFRWLAMPPLDEPPEPKDVEFRQQRGPETSLEEFLAAMMADNLEAEELDPRAFDVYSAGLEWVTKQRLIRIERMPAK